MLSGDVEKNPGPDAPDILSYNEYKDCMKFYTGHLKIVHINFQNMTGKHSDFKSFVNDVDCNTIVSVSETWLKDDDLTTFWSIPDFALFRTDICTITHINQKEAASYYSSRHTFAQLNAQILIILTLPYLSLSGLN